MRHFFFHFIFLCSLTGFLPSETRAEFYGTPPTGLLQVEKKHPYFLFVPSEYSLQRSWPLLILIGDRGEDPEALMAPWVEWARKHELIVAAIPNLVPQGELPASSDRWLFGIKQEIEERYRIERAKILLAGFGWGAHYAAYLGMNYPEKFSAAVLVRGSWEGPFQKLMKPVSDRERQVSFYLAREEKESSIPVQEAQARALEAKGYSIVSVPLKSDAEFLALRDQMIQWFQKESEVRAQIRKTASRKWKRKIGKLIEDFLGV